MHNFLLENNVITPFQSGFFPGETTVNKLVDLYNTFSRALDEGKEGRVVFCDISKAFDRVWHKGIIAKLKHYGISGGLRPGLKVACRIDSIGGRSEWLEIKAGVPQGPILGPLLFISYINDIVHEIHSNIRLFADDTTFYITADFPDPAAQILNVVFHRISNWAELWLVVFNASKTEAFLASRRTNRIIYPTLYLNDVPIQETTTNKYRGIFFSKRLDRQSHIDYIQQKAWSRINLLRCLKFVLDRKSLQKYTLRSYVPFLSMQT